MVFETLRQRFSHKLESHEIDEDFTLPSRTSFSEASSSASSVVMRTTNNAVVDGRGVVEVFGPADEEVPSYESSQMLHDQQMRMNERPNLSLANSSNVSRNSSVGLSTYAVGNGAMALPGAMAVANGMPSGMPSSMANGMANGIVNGVLTKSRNIETRNALKNIGLRFLKPTEHFALACCRDLSLVPCIIGLYQCWRRVVAANMVASTVEEVATTLSKSKSYPTTHARSSEHFLTGVWCIVAGYLSFSVLDGLMIRWIVTYLTSAAIVRMLSMSVMIVTVEQYLVSTFTAEGYKYGLHIWILISCCLTLTYIVQNFVTLNLDIKKKPRAKFFDFYNIAVFAVVPVGMASFITMIGLLRSLLILRLDIDQHRTSS